MIESVKDSSEPARPPVAAARRVVLKLGTRVLTHDDGKLALGRLYSVVEQVAALCREGREVLVVSSGAVGLGQEALGLAKRPEDLAQRQACAAIGQSRLMGLWDDGFSRSGLISAQVLLTEGDFEDRVRYLNLRRALASLLKCGVVPVINGNDVVCGEEPGVTSGSRSPVFVDNDRLAALVAAKLDADLLVLFTDVPGVFDGDPARPETRILERIDSPESVGAAGPSASGAGRGGMQSKVGAAFIAARGGCHAVIASGRDDEALRGVLSGQAVGTWVPACGQLAALRRWIGFAAAPRGVLTLDDGAVEALRSSGASLLAAGVAAVQGDFSAGDVLQLVDLERRLVGRGLIRWDAPTVTRWCSGHPPAELRKAGALIRRDNLVLEVQS